MDTHILEAGKLGLKFFFLLTPFFVLSMFLTMTEELTPQKRRRLADKVAFSALVICLVLLFFGKWIFSIFGITLDAFRIGGGALLVLSAVTLVNGAADKKRSEAQNPDSDISVVPLAIPVTVGPATTGALMIIGAEVSSGTELLVNSIGLLIALLIVWAFLRCANLLEKLLKHRGIVILSKLTGLVLAALAAEMIFTGIKNFMGKV